MDEHKVERDRNAFKLVAVNVVVPARYADHVQSARERLEYALDLIGV